jgi:hypothetical protein
MPVVETIAKIRRAYFVQKKVIKEIRRELKVSRKVVRKVAALPQPNALRASLSARDAGDGVRRALDLSPRFPPCLWYAERW